MLLDRRPGRPVPPALPLVPVTEVPEDATSFRPAAVDLGHVHRSAASVGHGPEWACRSTVAVGPGRVGWWLRGECPGNWAVLSGPPAGGPDRPDTVARVLRLPARTAGWKRRASGVSAWPTRATERSSPCPAPRRVTTTVPAVPARPLRRNPHRPAGPPPPAGPRPPAGAHERTEPRRKVRPPEPAAVRAGRLRAVPRSARRPDLGRRRGDPPHLRPPLPRAPQVAPLRQVAPKRRVPRERRLAGERRVPREHRAAAGSVREPPPRPVARWRPPGPVCFHRLAGRRGAVPRRAPPAPPRRLELTPRPELVPLRPPRPLRAELLWPGRRAPPRVRPRRLAACRHVLLSRRRPVRPERRLVRRIRLARLGVRRAS
ncbi:hypothetical protein FrEUN1fDRAFT_7475, partial [Parafrankia sp. EUN1f]